MNQGIFKRTWAMGVAILIVLVGFSADAEARKKKSLQKKQAQLEVYPAIEETEIAAEATPSEIRVSRTEVSVPTRSDRLDSLAHARALEERVNLLETVVTAAHSVESPRTTASAEFEVVPSGKEDMIAARLKIVEEILRESGRAYDYRVMTTQKLRQILASLRAERADAAKILAE